MRRVLFAVDDADLAKNLEKLPLSPSLAPWHVDTPAELLGAVYDLNPAAVVLCTQFSGRSENGRHESLDGIGILRQVREISTVPVLMISGLDIPSLQVLALQSGADAYLRPPLVPEILVAEIHALVRRSAAAESVYSFFDGRLRVHEDSREVFVESQPIELTHAELDLLLALIQAAPRVLTRDYLLRRLHHHAGEGSERSVDVHVSNLRKKLGDLAECIVTVRSEGYRFHH